MGAKSLRIAPLVPAAVGSSKGYRRAAQAQGEDASRCHGALCLTRTERTELCECPCDGCGLLLELLVRAERDVLEE